MTKTVKWNTYYVLVANIYISLYMGYICLFKHGLIQTNINAHSAWYVCTYIRFYRQRHVHPCILHNRAKHMSKHPG